jgi:hypothetical protein
MTLECAVNPPSVRAVNPPPVRAELVEALCPASQPFDTLSANGARAKSIAV